MAKKKAAPKQLPGRARMKAAGFTPAEVYLSPEQLVAIDQAAEKMGHKRATFIAWAAARYAEQLLMAKLP